MLCALTATNSNDCVCGLVPQELYRWETVAASSRLVLGLRYKLLPHLYTLLFMAHKFGTTVHNAMWMHFPSDAIAHTRDGQYMWSDSILFTPVLNDGARSVVGYFPRGFWYALFDESLIDTTASGGEFVTLITPLNSTNAHVRGGSIIPMQIPAAPAMTTGQVHASPFTLLVALNEARIADGYLYLDDGVQNELSRYTWVHYTVPSDNTLIADVQNSSYVLNTALLTNIDIYGITSTSATCSASLKTAAGGIVKASSAVVTTRPKYQKLAITFAQSSAVNVATSFTLTWSCVDSGSESNDDNSGFDALPDYAKALSVIAIIFGGIAVVAAGYFGLRAYAIKKGDEPLLRSLV
jgi:hypothetical protein